MIKPCNSLTNLNNSNFGGDFICLPKVDAADFSMNDNSCTFLSIAFSSILDTVSFNSTISFKTSNIMVDSEVVTVG